MKKKRRILIESLTLFVYFVVLGIVFSILQGNALATLAGTALFGGFFAAMWYKRRYSQSEGPSAFMSSGRAHFRVRYRLVAFLVQSLLLIAFGIIALVQSSVEPLVLGLVLFVLGLIFAALFWKTPGGRELEKLGWRW